ncbi:metallophosphoesterase [Chitinophaga silvatica]|uniref:Metallophosphoesterase n=1 Tax=Chitinophaga silvatica TaxID=2282649 RepID=A0A3E1Y736_9BACT|nr:metallophosphoesterase family protein [Chitinophaga silvatica]RFS20752.1 metallophosphoesterase [Chitinophaga silvatica]
MRVTFIAAALLLSIGSLQAQTGITKPDNIKPALIRGPYLQAATSNSIVIRWRTDSYTRSRVQYGTEPGKLDQQAQNADLVTEHKIKITDLKPNTRYYYSIGGYQYVLQGDENNRFTTLPVSGTTGLFRIAALGDCGNNSVNQRQVKDQLIKYLGNKELNAWILLGDNAYPNGKDAEYQSNFFNVYKDDLLRYSPLFPAPGNHDYRDNDISAKYNAETHQTAYFQNFTMPTEGEAGGLASHNPAFYSFDVGNVHFLSLDSYGLEDNSTHMWDTAGAQAQWVLNDLAANKNKDWVVAYFHHPPYTMGSHDSDDEDDLIAIRENFIHLLERNGVDLVVNGHSHVYERSRLMQNHFGKAATFDPKKNNLSQSTGRYDGKPLSAPYIKDSANTLGTVYIVSGSAGQLGGKHPGWPHKAMYYSDNEHGGSCILEAQENRLDVKWICADGEVRDQFTMMKNVNKHHNIYIKKNETATLTASFVGQYKWAKNEATTRSINVTPTAAVTKYTVTDPYNNLKDTFTVYVSK